MALGVLHHHIGNTNLLKLADGGRITIERIGPQQSGVGQILGWNDGRGTIALTEATFETDLALWKTVYHEFGHNWDEVNENPFVGDFRENSGWTPWQPTVIDWRWHPYIGWYPIASS